MEKRPGRLPRYGAEKPEKGLENDHARAKYVKTGPFFVPWCRFSGPCKYLFSLRFLCSGFFRGGEYLDKGAAVKTIRGASRAL